LGAIVVDGETTFNLILKKCDTRILTGFKRLGAMYLSAHHFIKGKTLLASISR
jgi:hypothetical protein